MDENQVTKQDKPLNYVFFATEYDWYPYMYQEILQRDNVKYYKDITVILTTVEKILILHLRGNSTIKRLVYKRALKRISFGNKNEICFIHFSRFLPHMRNGLIEAERSVFPASRQVHFFSDAQHITDSNISFLRKNMDAIGVYDPSLAERYKIRFWPNAFPSLKPESEEIEYDLCFVGNGLGRSSKIEKIADFCKENGLKTAIFLMNPDGPKKNKNITYLDSMIPYRETVELVQKSRCVLELQRDYGGCSMRVLEAVILNKKILTDNINVFRMPCCEGHAQFIHYFQDVDDIDIDFFKVDDVDYKYAGQYSADRFLKRVCESVQNTGIYEGKEIKG